MRNKGFAFTTADRLARWDDIGGPGRFEKWGLENPLQFVASRLLIGLGGVGGALVMGWLLAGDPGFALAVAGGYAIGTVLVVLVAGKRQWARERDVYDAWLSRRRRPQAAARVDT